MKPLIDISPGEVIKSGVLPNAMNEEIMVWAQLNNVVLDSQGIGRPIGAVEIDTVTEEISYIVQQTLKDVGNRAFIAGDTGIWIYDGATIALVNQPFTAGGMPTLETWGDWTVANNNIDPPKVRKGTGTFDNLAGVNFTKCLQMIRRSPFMLALGTSDGPTWVRWCTDDNLEDWTVKPENKAGDFTIRDIPGAIKGGCSLGDSILIYSQESITLCTFVGMPYVFSFVTTIHGVGIWGPKAVCETNRKNYGLGPQGAFMTDGYQFQLLGDDHFRKWLTQTLDSTKPHKVTVFHNEITDTIEFRFPTKTNAWAALYWKLDAEKFAMGDLRCDAAIERDVFDTPFIGVGTSFCKYTRDADDWVGVKYLSTMATKWMDCGSIEYDKFLDHVFINGQLENVDLLVEMQDLEQNERIVFILRDAERQNFVLEEGHKIRVTLIANGDFHVSRIRLFGEQGAAAI